MISSSSEICGIEGEQDKKMYKGRIKKEFVVYKFAE